ncbi:bifunctional nuclease family protein [Sediminitomix flava]|uniref:BFN domain-containing protein n=1 Tax=Sediminitomix flava TaxID=379075 RepID=A0A315ZBQ8_SEDFL|nr:bifunctional nuclease family protein [Sediminitomix flava]PWJ42800.1 hypothetical protein BC781_102346 [Sediminitomix flava]
MDKVKLKILGLSPSHTQSGSFALVLGETEGNRRLPIIIGMFEAQAIALEMEQIVANRPMTHDLFKAFALEFNIHIEEIIISNLKEGVFYATIRCADENGKVTEMDARPSDAVALAVRFKAPIFAAETVLKEAGIRLDELEEEEEVDDLTEEIESEPTVEAYQESAPIQEFSKEDLKKLPTEQLRQMMEKAIEKEDYERAATIRDELSKRG